MSQKLLDQLNVNTLIGAITLAAICWFGKVVMDSHDAVIMLTTQVPTMQTDISTIKAQLPEFAIKSEVDNQFKAVWTRVANSPKHAGQQSQEQ